MGNRKAVPGKYIGTASFIKEVINRINAQDPLRRVSVAGISQRLGYKNPNSGGTMLSLFKCGRARMSDIAQIHDMCIASGVKIDEAIAMLSADLTQGNEDGKSS